MVGCCSVCLWGAALNGTNITLRVRWSVSGQLLGVIVVKRAHQQQQQQWQRYLKNAIIPRVMQWKYSTIPTSHHCTFIFIYIVNMKKVWSFGISIRHLLLLHIICFTHSFCGDGMPRRRRRRCGRWKRNWFVSNGNVWMNDATFGSPLNLNNWAK